jgi:hypothetical protein
LAEVSSHFIGESVVIERTTVSVGRADLYVVRAVRRPYNLFEIGVVVALGYAINVDRVEHARNHEFIGAPVFL